MNRLVLIGNGFDLAHGLKTSYKDFLFWYLDQCFEGAGIYANGHKQEDNLVCVEVFEHFKVMALLRASHGKGVSRYLYEKNQFLPYLEFNSEKKYAHPDNIEKFRTVSEVYAHKVSFKSVFLKDTVFHCLDCGWVDIEAMYFKHLRTLNKGINGFVVEEINKLNSEFEYLKSKFNEYLTSQYQEIKLTESILDQFYSDFKYEDFHFKEDSEFDDAVEYKLGKPPKYKLCFLNFNYTLTAGNYLRENDEYFTEASINYIHGRLGDQSNPIIFGFGDEIDEDYKTFENLGINELFTHIKSYYYLKTPNYRNLAAFLNSDYYQFIVGHSCGLSDRTMLKEIFDHENCKSVRIFHYTDEDGNNDFFDKSINVGRHFTDKGRMRKVVVEYREEDSIPQVVRVT